MFELSIAFKYLSPRWRQLSVSIISLISILVIALVVWLIVVFFSVTYGLERNWIDRLIALTAPVRILPTDSYYNSYYYQVDSISSASNYSHKTIGEKRNAPNSDPYDREYDQEVPSVWLKPDLDPSGKLKDPVAGVFAAVAAIKSVPEVKARDYEMTMGQLKLQLLRLGDLGMNQAQLSQTSYLGSFDPDNQTLNNALLPLSEEDIGHLFEMSSFGPQEEQGGVQLAPPEQVQEKLKQFFSLYTIRSLKMPASGWSLPKELYPHKATWKAVALFNGDQISKLFVSVATATTSGQKGELQFHEGKVLFKQPGKEPLPLYATPIILRGDLAFKADVEPLSIEKALHHSQVRFHVQGSVQGTLVQGATTYGNLLLGQVEKANQPVNLHKDPVWGYGVLLPRGFKDAGVLAGDRGAIVYLVPSAASLQEQRLPIYVAGFYDPGIIPIGGKFIIVPQEITALIRSAYTQDDTMQGNGINVRFSHLDQADEVKAQLEKAFQDKGIASYWKVETYKEYDFTKNVIQQLRSEKNLFTLLATIIIVVACSNIVSMLIILVNDKKIEIGILRSMGATSRSIALIFGICGIVMGALGSAIGILAALLTLRHLQTLVNFISFFQGHDLFNPIYYGEKLPSALSWESIGFVIATTAFISLISGLVPAIKASMMRPSAILRAE